jgi:hypothetical protein
MHKDHHGQEGKKLPVPTHQAIKEDKAQAKCDVFQNRHGYYILTASVVYWAEVLATDPEVRVPFPALPDFLRRSGSGTGSTQPREYN